MNKKAHQDKHHDRASIEAEQDYKAAMEEMMETQNNHEATADESQTESAQDETLDQGEPVQTDPVEQLKIELAAKNDALLRTVAEYQNYRKRVEKEKQDLIRYGNEKILTDLLQIVDNFDRALSSLNKEDEALLPVINGVEMIKMSFDGLMEKYGVKEIDALGQPFNPEAHHAVMTGESEGADSNTVIEIFQKGYSLHEKIIRPAMVKVQE